jgi:hypothetical protein
VFGVDRPGAGLQRAAFGMGGPTMAISVPYRNDNKRLTEDQLDAMAVVEQWSHKALWDVWVGFTREDFFNDLKWRIAYPEKIMQSVTNLCGPAALAYVLARDYPREYAQSVLELYFNHRTYLAGAAIVGTKLIETPWDIIRYDIGPSGMSGADWVLLASLRNQDNWWFDYHRLPPWLLSDKWFCATTAGQMEMWLRQLGYQHVIEETSLVFCEGLDSAFQASRYRDNGYQVFLCVNHQLLQWDHCNEWSPYADHWIALTSPINIFIDYGVADFLNFTAFSWGRICEVKMLPKESFLKNYYGYVAAKF